MILSADIEIAWRTVWGEARGESQEGREAVAHVFWNRLRSKTGQWSRDDTLATCCLRDKQFSVWNSNDPNFLPMQLITLEDATAWACLQAVLDSRFSPDPTGGAHHYKVVGTPAVWAQGHNPYAVIGHHEFFVGIA